jgi:glycerol-3-phosphate dehydrogenase (NAD(P)+)
MPKGHDSSSPRSGPSKPAGPGTPSKKARRAPDAHDPARPTVTILGLGQMGLVCAGLLASERHGNGSPDADDRPGTIPASRPVNVRLWGHDAEEAGQIAQSRKSARLPGFDLPTRVHVCLSDAEALEGSDLIVSAVPVQFMREAWTRLARHVPKNAGAVSVAKGIENGTLLRPTQIIAEVLHKAGRDDPDGKPRPLGVLSGPTIAAEMARGLPTTMIAASDDPAFARAMQGLFSGSWMRIYTQTDVLGVELAGAVKNVVAIAAGIVDGLQAGNNAKSALLARGLAEIARLGLSMGASPETFFGIAGVGDLATTCFSPEGRNRTCGEALGKGTPLDEFLKGSAHVVEGVATTKSVVALAAKYKVEMPIVQAVHAVLFEDMDPIDAIGRLMSRQPKAERVGRIG